MNVSSACNDGSFGPGVKHCDRDFDFTLSFEESILSIAPSVIFIFLGSIRTLRLQQKQRVVAGRHFQLTKLVGKYLLVSHIIKLTDSIVCCWCSFDSTIDVGNPLVYSERAKNTTRHSGRFIVVHWCLTPLCFICPRTRQVTSSVGSPGRLSLLLFTV